MLSTRRPSHERRHHQTLDRVTKENGQAVKSNDKLQSWAFLLGSMGERGQQATVVYKSA